jgi:crossover junction endodeoxyribonuclease RuvC
MKILAIDPGASGGWALLDNEGAVTVEPMWQTEGDIVDGLRGIKAMCPDAIAIVEEVGGFIGAPMPGSAMFKFGRGFGFLLGVLQTLGYRVELVRPQKWQKALSLGTRDKKQSKTEWKNKLKAEAQRRYPNHSVTLKTADALLLLEYGRKIAT